MNNNELFVSLRAMEHRSIVVEESVCSQITANPQLHAIESVYLGNSTAARCVQSEIKARLESQVVPSLHIFNIIEACNSKAENSSENYKASKLQNISLDFKCINYA